MQIFKDRGIDVTFDPSLGKDKDKLAAVIGEYDGLAIRSATTVTALPADAQAAFAKQVVSIIEKAGAGYDLGHYRDAPPGLRIWCGATVQSRDLKALLPWIAYAFAEAKAGLKKAA